LNQYLGVCNCGCSRRAVTATSSSENATLSVIAFLLRIKHARFCTFRT
jgi:hypothetical protein